MQNIIKLNKEALRIALTNSNSVCSSNVSTDSTKVLNLVLHSLYEENASLLQINEKISIERNLA